MEAKEKNPKIHRENEKPNELGRWGFAFSMDVPGLEYSCVCAMTFLISQLLPSIIRNKNGPFYYSLLETRFPL